MIAFVRRHRYPVLAVALVLVVLVLVTLWWFQPQRLLYDDTVDEALPVPLAPVAMVMPSTPELEVLARGDFRDRGHATSGQVRVLDLGAGQRVLRLENFATTNGPDLRVYLSPVTADAPNDQLNDGAVSLGNLKGNRGNQNYSVPAELRLTEFQSVVIWCKRFSYAFGTAALS